jgi:hypothetical protein
MITPKLFSTAFTFSLERRADAKGNLRLKHIFWHLAEWCSFMGLAK